jgi:uncharacterized membrane protein
MQNRMRKINQMQDRHLYTIIVVISLVCLILSIVIYLEKTHYSLHHNSICSAITGTNGCEVVQTSEYGKTFGIDNPVYGMIGFTALGILSLILMIKDKKKNHKTKNDYRNEHGYNGKNLIEYLTIAGGIVAGSVAIWFFYAQAFIIHTYCLFCVIVDVLSLILLGLSIYMISMLFRHRQNRQDSEHK